MNDFLNDVCCDGLNMCFTPKEVEKGWHLKIINAILDMNKEYDGEGHFDIIITSDDFCTIVRASRAGAINEREAIFVDADDVVMTRHNWTGEAYFTFKGDEEKYKLVPIVEDIESPIE